MAIAHVGTSGTNSGTGTSATVTYSPASGNHLAAYVRIVSTATSLVTQSGWTKLTQTTTTLGGTNQIIAIYWKTAGAGETSENPVQWTGSVSWAMVLDEYSAVTTVSPVDTENSATNASATPLTTPTVTPMAGVERLVVCGVSAAVSATWTTDQVNASATGVGSRGSVGGSHLFDLVVALTSGTYQGRSTPNATNSSEAAAIAMFKGNPIRIDGRNYLQAVKRASFY